MPKKTYEPNDDHSSDDPGNRVCAALSRIDAPEASRALNEVLYTACERGILPDLSIDAETALTIYRLVELARTASADDISAMRM